MSTPPGLPPRKPGPSTAETSYGGLFLSSEIQKRRAAAAARVREEIFTQIGNYLTWGRPFSALREILRFEVRDLLSRGLSRVVERFFASCLECAKNNFMRVEEQVLSELLVGGRVAPSVLEDLRRRFLGAVTLHNLENE